MCSGGTSHLLTREVSFAGLGAVFKRRHSLSKDAIYQGAIEGKTVFLVNTHVSFRVAMASFVYYEACRKL